MTTLASSIFSAQVTETGQSRFVIPMMDDPAWASAAAAEALGGVDADIRVFLDAQLSRGDVMVDLAPGFGFVALSAATAPDGMPTVFVVGLSSERLLSLQDAASAEGGWLEALDAADLSTLGAVVGSRLEPEGRLIMRATCAQLPALSTTLQPLIDAERLLAVCVSDAHESNDWSAAAAVLASLGFTACALVHHDEEVMLVPAAAPPHAAVIALPTALIAVAP